MPSYAPMSFLSEELNHLKRHWGLFLVFGVLLIVLGGLAIAMPFVAGLWATMVIGIMLLVGGAVHVLGAFRARGWGAFFLHALVGILYAVTGLLMVDKPVDALLVLTMLVAAALLVGGLFRVVLSVANQFPGWGWVLLGGLIDVILGLLIWQRLPVSAFWVIGLFVGISMVYNGATWVALALSLREVPVPPGSTPSQPAGTPAAP